MIEPYHVIVQFGSGIPSDAQGPVLLAMERSLREAGIAAEVYKPTAADDLKPRSMMSIEQRNAL